MINITSSMLIYQPIKRVFDFITKPENDFQWQYGTLLSAPISVGDPKVGASFRSVGHLMGNRTQSTYEVTEYEPNKKYGFKSLSGPLNSLTSYTFEIAQGCTKVNITIRADVINPKDFNETLIEKKMRRQVKDDLSMLKDILESTERAG